MVSGTKWPDGDPYLQRQNEPSLAGSTRNPMHLLAGANDYRTVDVPFVTGAEETGDAWLGLFKSFDGGQRWQSTLLPGYPQDTSAEGLASPIYGYQAGADLVVRAGTNGLFYYAGLVFDREANGRSAVFVARFIDNNNQEDNYKANRDHVVGDPVKYIGTRIVSRNSGTRFLDKPWIAADIPRDGRTCRIPGPNGTSQRIPAGNVYMAFSSIYEDRQGLRSDILLSRSSDCGATWSAPARVNDASDRINQGATIAIDPRNGTVHIAWRRFASGAVLGQTDGIMTAQSTNGGSRFSAPGVSRAFYHGLGRKIGLDPERYFEHRRKSKSKAKPKVGTPHEVAAEVGEFDQETSDIDGFLMFRTNAYPTMAVDGSGRIYMVWTERGFTQSPGNEARIVMATSRDGRNRTQPQAVANEGPVGHQIMPSLTFGGGRLVLVYYDLREDISGQFTQLIDDKGAIASINKRHTMDLRASIGMPGATPVFAPSVRVSDYLVAFRKTPNGTLVPEQVQFNPPNLPMFKQGTAPFMGDYVDVAVTPAFVPTSTGGWAFNTDGSQPVFHAVWTDNRDVRQPKAAEDSNGNGNPWDDYTPPTSRIDRTSVFDPSVMIPPCDPFKTGSRNQNIYTARLSSGLVVGSPGNTKPLSPPVPSGATEDPKPTPLSLVFVQHPSTTQFGSVVAPTVSVAVRDQYGAVLPSADVTLFLGTNPTGAVLSGASGTSDTNGLATFPGLSLGAAGAGYTIVATAGQALPAVSDSFNVGAASATVSLGNLAQTYDGTAKTATATTTPSGLSYSLTSTNNGTAAVPINAGSYDVVATITNPNYSGSTSGTLVVSKATATVSVINAVVTYDGSPHGVSATSTPNGLALIVTSNGGPEPTNAGSYPVIATVDDLNYEGIGNGTLTINKATPSVTWFAPAAITYGTVLGATQLNATASVPGAFVYTPAAGTVLPAGAGQTLSVTFTPTDTANYAAATAAVTIGVGQATPVITWANPAAITYGTALGATQLNATANGVSGVFVYTPAAGSVLAAGLHQTLSVTLTPTDPSFTSVSSSVAIDVHVLSSLAVNVPGTAGGTVNDNVAGGPAVALGTPPVDTGLFLNAGNTVTITATGGVSWSGNPDILAGPAGVDLGLHSDFLAVSPPTPGISLIARIGTGPWQFVGAGPTTLMAGGPGTRQLAVNDSYYSDNGGAFVASITFSTPPVEPPAVVTTAPAGGSGGSSFGPIDCPTGSVATALTGSYDMGYAPQAIVRTGIWCTPISGGSLVPPATLAGVIQPPPGSNTLASQIDYGNALTCPAGQVITGLFGSTASNIVKTLGVRCDNPGGGNTVSVGPAGYSTGTPFTLNCPAGQIGVGIQGRQGWNLDQISLRCSPAPPDPGQQPEPGGETRSIAPLPIP